MKPLQNLSAAAEAKLGPAGGDSIQPDAKKTFELLLPKCSRGSKTIVN